MYCIAVYKKTPKLFQVKSFIVRFLAIMASEHDLECYLIFCWLVVDS